MDIIKEALMQWGEAMQVSMENRTLFYSPVLGHWRVKKWAGKNARSLIYDDSDFMIAFKHLLGAHASEQIQQTSGGTNAPKREGDEPVSR